MGFRSQGAVGESQNQTVGEVEEVQGEGRGWGGSLAGGRRWVEQEVGELD